MSDIAGSPHSLKWQEIRAQVKLRKQLQIAPAKRKAKDHNAVIGIGGSIGHDSNAALLVDGQLVAAMQEERFTGIKHDGCFPFRAIEECLKIGGITADQIDVCVFSEKVVQKSFFHSSNRASNAISEFAGRFLPPAWFNTFPAIALNLFPNASYRYTWHHLAHAASAFYSSTFEEATFLCVDGIAEDMSASIGKIDRQKGRILYEQPYENGLGLLFSLITYYLGFHSIGSEYKVMGLAPYGTPVYRKDVYSMLVNSEQGGSRLKVPLRFGPGQMEKGCEFVRETFQLDSRRPGDALTQQHVNIAASLQAVFENEILKMADYAHRTLGGENLLFCGGCAQNCVAAGKLRDFSPFPNVFNSPVGTDMSNGLGAALIYEQTKSEVRKLQVNLSGFYLGSEPGEIPFSAHSHRVDLTESIHETTAKLLAEGKIVGWVRGRMELGARALGARSILADPRHKDMQSALNMKIKFRESFRPFAPAILSEEAHNWFDLKGPSDFMQFTAYLKEEHRYEEKPFYSSFADRLNHQRCAIPSVVHVDYSARLQTVNANVHPDFHKLIYSFFKLTNVPMIINTSFNVNGQAIVRTASQAWDCFVNTEIDYLVIGDSLFKNPFIRTQKEKMRWLKNFEAFSN